MTAFKLGHWLEIWKKGLETIIMNKKPKEPQKATFKENGSGNVFFKFIPNLVYLTIWKLIQGLRWKKMFNEWKKTFFRDFYFVNKFVTRYERDAILVSTLCNASATLVLSIGLGLGLSDVCLYNVSHCLCHSWLQEFKMKAQKMNKIKKTFLNLLHRNLSW